PSAVGSYPRRAVLAVELLRALPAALHGRIAPVARSLGVREPRHRLLGAAEALRCAVGNHAAAPGQRVTCDKSSRNPSRSVSLSHNNELETSFAFFRIRRSEEGERCFQL